MANPYYPPGGSQRQRGQNGQRNPLSIPYPQDHPYLGTPTNAHFSDPYAPGGYGDGHDRPFYNPYANVSNVQLEPQSHNASSENLVGGVKQSFSEKRLQEVDLHPYHTDDGLPLPSQPFARGYGGVTAATGPGRSSRDIERPESPFDGVYKDRPPVWEKLNPEQREILKQFPPDLDDANGGKSGMQAVKDMLKNWKQFFRLKYLHWWIILLICGAVVALVTIYHTQIVDWLTPISKKANSVSWGWTIPVAILFVLSFPPLFGQEIVLVLVGIVYGLWLGFGIASLGTLLGEIGNFYAFKYCLRSTAAKYERKNIYYACMAEMVREGGFWVMFLARLSAVPGHFTTAVFATVGMNIWIFTLAAVLSLPKQLIIVYFGVAIEQAGGKGESTASKIIKYVVLAITVIITIWTAHWLYMRMEKVRPDVQRKLRMRRYDLLTDARGSEYTARGGPSTAEARPVESNGEDRDTYELRPRQAGHAGYSQASPAQYAGAETSGRYHGADEAYNRAPASYAPSQAPASPQQNRAPSANAAGAIQFHRPLRKQTHEDAPATPPIDPGGFDHASDLSQARAELMLSPASPGARAANQGGRPNIRLDTQLNAKYQHASELGSVYMLGSEASTAPMHQGSFQPGQIVSPSSLTPPGQDPGAPVPALQASYHSPQAEHFSERSPLRGNEDRLSPTSPGADHAPAHALHGGSHADAAGSQPNHRPYGVSPTSTAAYGYERDAPPAYASTPYLADPSQQLPPQQRVSDEVTRYQLHD
ncbi:uncharacterized protein PFL1_00507 [Pseudozyma flocculosa PF-1]|uniref:Golgi apparatus membrane protein TVP38 n=1 Tax=Pseudozyma flocculosa TaxID=84751 RepID=A0A5C3EUL8_9BASI|nr:uncharacterized protein PFL1_00507 [Pseudozyma flocculosa PF-1]EPQ32311.1 hypothetical protein PFL1_00507 [Pseudozyma flocculosa PF-1]SPO34731.1 uncharacterized protein PSFLO_00202 [Pseudozyma flocculosa]